MLELTEEDQIGLLKNISEVQNSMVRIEAERDLIKEILADIKEKYKISPAIIRKVATFLMNTEKKEKAAEEFDIVDFLVELSENG